MKRTLFFLFVVVLIGTTGCVGTTKSSLTMNKTIDLDKRALDGVQISFRLEVFR